MNIEHRREFAQRQHHAMVAAITSPDFTRLDCIEARRRVRQLCILGLSDWTIADLVGWSVADVRRALSERTQ